MKNLVFIILTILLSKYAKAQIQIAETLFEGKMVKVYPYRVNGKTNSSDNLMLNISQNLDIPYCPLTLPTGEYVAFYLKFFHYDKHENVIYLKGDTDNVAIHFYIVNGKKEGVARWFTTNYTKKKVYQSGKFVNDLKEGEWLYTTKDEVTKYNYNAGLLNGKVERKNKKYGINSTYGFQKGVIHGKYSNVNTKTKDKMEIEFMDGNMTGAFYLLKHKVSIRDIKIMGFDDNNYISYKSIEIQGKLYKDLKYGAWEIRLDQQKFLVYYDTLKSYPNDDNYNHRNAEIGRDWSDFFTSFNLRDQSFIESNEPYYYLASKDFSRYNTNEWNWKYRALFGTGTGYFVEYDLMGNTLNADSFSNGYLKIPFVIKDLDGSVKITILRDKETIDLFKLVNYNNKITTSTTLFLKNKSTLVELEKSTEDRINPKYTNLTINRYISYYKYYNLTSLKTIMVDSTILKYKDNSNYTSTTNKDVYSGYRFHQYFFNNEAYSQNWHLDSLRNFIITPNSEKIGDLTIIDTVFIPLGAIRNILTDTNYTDAYEITNSRIVYSFRDTMHVCVLWKDKPLTGTVNFKIFYDSYKQKNYYAKEEVGKGSFFFNNFKIINAALSEYTLNTVFPPQDNEQRKAEFLEINVRDGVLTGNQRMMIPLKKSANPITIYSVNYLDNLKNGYEITLYYDYYIKPSRFKNNLLKVNGTSFNRYYNAPGIPLRAENKFESFNFFKDGRQEGIKLVRSEDGALQNLRQFQQDKLEGECIEFGGYEQPIIKCHFKNDTLNGLYENFNANYEITDIANFKDGLIHGKYFQYQYRNVNDLINKELEDKNIKFCNERKINTIELEFNNGYLINTGKYYHCDGILKATIEFDIKDSIKLLEFQNNKSTINYTTIYEGTGGYNSTLGRYTNQSPLLTVYKKNNDLFDYRMTFSFYANLPGYYKYYYKSGVQSQEGRVDKFGLKTGWWKFWNENGILMKEILYEKGIVVNPTNSLDTIKYTGKIKGYYPNGKFMMEGYVLDEDLKYECVQDEEIAYQQVFYLKFVDDNGNNIFNNYTGTVRDYHLNGNKREEGQLVNGKRNGQWRTYVSNGNLSSIGNYINDKKDGIWISGDLSGIGFVDNQCFDNVIDISKIKGNLNEKHLEFDEFIYKEGALIKYTRHEVNLD